MAVRIESKAEPLPGYTLIERIGGGGFGEVWKASAPGGLLKAIKFVFGDLSGAGDESQRAEQELKALSRVKTVRHPYILSLERYDIIEGQLLIVMELADRNLWDRFKECRSQGLEGIPRDELMQYMEETAEALDLMNSQYQLQHLDIKPQNIFLIHNHVKVADFGLAKDMEGTHASVTGGVTPVYAAPETFDGKVTRFCDQYSLAIVYQELLTGRRPFNGTNVRQLILQHIQAVPDVSPLPPADRPVIARGLSKLSTDRFPTCREMVTLLRQNTYAREAVISLPSGPSANGHAPPTVLDPRIGTPRHDSQPSSSKVDIGANPGKGSSSGASTVDLRPPDCTPDSSQGPTRIIRAETPSQSARDQRQQLAEINGDGVLLPALVIGLGQIGMLLLQRLRETLTEEFGSLDNLPHLRLLLLDTDPEVMRTATRGRSGAALSANDVMLTGLQRPSYYLKPRDGKPALESWLNPKMLYRIPRSQVTTGVRALGRLAFCDNYRAISRRLQLELEACLDPDALTQAMRQTKLGMRTNRPRVYVLCGLAGGTGSGMFLDLAYSVRAALKALGYEKPDVVGVFLLPPLDSNRTKVMALGNTYAALTELKHFATPGTTFVGNYLEREPAISDTEPPFSRCVLLPLPEESDEPATRKLIDLGSQFLYCDLFTPLGRTADLARAGEDSPPWQQRGLYYQTFGLHQVCWPRRVLLRTVGRLLCQRLVQRWLSKDSKPMREGIQTWVQEQWAAQGLGAERFISRLRDGCQEVLHKPPETLFHGLIEPLLRKVTMSPATMRRGAAATELTPEEIAEILTRIEEWIGKPQDDGAAEQSAQLLRILRQVTETVTNHWAQKMAELPVHLIEEPSYRLAGAEEAIRHLVTTIEQILQHHEPLCKDLTARTAEAYGHLQLLCGPLKPGGRRPSIPAREVVELLKVYPKYRFQSQMLQQVAGAFVSLRGHLSDELREINFCRVRLGELLHQFEVGTTVAEDTAMPVIGRLVFPSGCAGLDEAVQRFLGNITPELLAELDGKVEDMIRHKFTALVNICMTSANILKSFELAMLETAEQFAGSLLSETNAAEMFLEQYPDQERAADELGEYYDQAAPELQPPRPGRAPSICLLAAPDGAAGEGIRGLVHSALPDLEIHTVTSTDDIVIYREVPNLPLAELPQMGALGQTAYRQMNAADNFTPHTRTDVNFGKDAG